MVTDSDLHLQTEADAALGEGSQVYRGERVSDSDREPVGAGRGIPGLEVATGQLSPLSL